MRQFLNLLVVAMISFNVLVSGKKDNNDSGKTTCQVSNPVEEISWLKEEIQNLTDAYSYYVMANYKGETVFYYGNCNPAINYISYIRNCNGDNLGFTNTLSGDLTDNTILWKHEKSQCVFRNIN